jgi:hypothetical protein
MAATTSQAEFSYTYVGAGSLGQPIDHQHQLVAVVVDLAGGGEASLPVCLVSRADSGSASRQLRQPGGQVMVRQAILEVEGIQK